MVRTFSNVYQATTSYVAWWTRGEPQGNTKNAELVKLWTETSLALGDISAVWRRASLTSPSR
jgi:hypothetical protein